jgi:hypothetical protein
MANYAENLDPQSIAFRALHSSAKSIFPVYLILSYVYANLYGRAHNGPKTISRFSGLEAYSEGNQKQST